MDVDKWSRPLTVDAPGHEPWTSGKCADGDEVDSHVTDIGIGVPSQNGEASNRKSCGAGQIDASPAGLIADVGNQDRAQTRTHIWRD